MLFKLHTFLRRLATWALIPFLILLLYVTKTGYNSLLGYILPGAFLLFTLCKAALHLAVAWRLIKKGNRAKAQVTFVYRGRNRLHDDIRISVSGRELTALNSYPLMAKPREGKSVSVLFHEDAGCALILGKPPSYWAAPALDLVIFGLLGFMYAKIILFT